MPYEEMDIRVFRRYPREIAFPLAIGGRSFTAKTVDYSFNSLGIAVTNAGEIAPGDMLDLQIDELGIHQKGKVIWARKRAGTVRVGLARLGSLTGNLKDYRLSDIVIGLQRTLKMGVLKVKKGHLRKSIYFVNGNPVFATSNLEQDRLGDVLLKEGRLTQDQYDHAAGLKRRTDGRYVAILVKSGFIAPGDLLNVVTLQSTRIIESLFELNDTYFEFVEGSVSAPPIMLSLPVADLVYKAVKKTADVELLKRYLPGSILDFSSTPLNLFQNVVLEKSDRALVSFVDGRTRVDDIIRLSSLEPDECLRCFHALLESRILLIKEADMPSSGTTLEELSAGVDEVFGDLIMKIDEMYARYENLDYYSLLGVGRSDPQALIRKAYFKAAREFHPDMNYGLPGDIKEKLISIFVRITNAYITLSDREKKVQYNKSLLAKAAPASPGPHKAGFCLDESPAERPRTARPKPGPDMSANRQIARDNYEEGKKYFRRSNMEKALNCFATAIYFDSSRPEYHYFYGVVLGRLDRLKEALQTLGRSLEMAPRNADILAELGHVYLKLGCPIRAAGNFERALSILPAHERAHDGLTLLSQRTRQARG